MSEGELIFYSTEGGAATIGLRAIDGTVRRIQMEMAELFDTSKQNVGLHIDNILSGGSWRWSQLSRNLTTAADGKAYRTKVYNLDVILAVGYRVRSPRGAQFRRWATTVLREYLVTGFVMDEVADPPSVVDAVLAARAAGNSGLILANRASVSKKCTRSFHRLQSEAVNHKPLKANTLLRVRSLKCPLVSEDAPVRQRALRLRDTAHLVGRRSAFHRPNELQRPRPRSHALVRTLSVRPSILLRLRSTSRCAARVA